MSAIGHNETAVRLAALAGDAQIALDKVAKGEADAIEGWLAYGAALNEGRALFPGDREFGQWLEVNDLNMMATFNLKREAHAALCNGEVAKAEVDVKERIAAMWAAANADQLAEARANSKARTLRGWHDQWKKIDAQRQADERKAEQEAARKKAAAEAEAKRKEAAEAAEAEALARAAVKSASDETARQKAEARAEEASQAKAAAEAAADAAEQAAEPPATPDPHAALRREFRSLTDEAQEDDWIALRLEIIDLKKRIAEQRDQLAEVKSENAALRESEGGRSLGNALRQARAAEGRMKEHQATAARLQKQVNAQKAEITDLKRQLENKVYVL